MTHPASSYRIRCLAGFLVCAGLLGFALYAQYVWMMDPCPLCIFQRVAFVGVGLFFLLGAIHGPRAGGRVVYLVPLLVSALAGLGIAGRQLWIQSLPADQVPSCGPGLGYLVNTFPFMHMLKIVLTGSGECAKVQKVLGLPMPAWSVLWFVLLALWGLWATVSGYGRRRASFR
ncbi:disulfide bond formation protein B [Frateuria aurantia]